MENEEAKEITRKKKEALFYKDKHIIECNPNTSKKNLVELTGINPESYDIIKGKVLTKEFKEASRIFSGKIAQAERFIKTQPIFYDKSGLWWLWNNNRKCWEMKDEIDISNCLYLSLGFDTTNAKERAEILQALKQIGRLSAPKPIPTNWIQFKDTFFDIKTGEEISVTSDYFAINPIPYKLHSEKHLLTPMMDNLFEEWVGKEYVKTLYEIIAYCLIPDYPIHRLFCFIGSGLNGKGCFLRLLKKFIGIENCCATELDSLLNSRFEVTRLHKKLVCVMGETNFNEMSKTSILKKLTGQDLIGFEYKNKNPFDDINYAKIIIATNSLPATTDKTDGFYRRWMIIDFPNQFSEKEDVLDRIPEEEYECLAVKCVTLIMPDLLKNRQFHNEGTIIERKEKYESKSNFLEEFIKTNTDEDFNGYITKAEFYKRFISWCKENRHRELSETSVGMFMKKINISESKKYFDWMYDGKGGQARIWLGLKWRE